MNIFYYLIAVATQLDKNLQGRLTWNAGSSSSMSTALVWDHQKHHLAGVIQVKYINAPFCHIYMYFSISGDFFSMD